MSIREEIQEAQKAIQQQGQNMIKQMQKELDLRYSAIIQNCKTMKCLESMIKPYKKLEHLAYRYWQQIELELSLCVRLQQQMGNEGYLRCLNGMERLMRTQQTKNILFKNLQV